MAQKRGVGYDPRTFGFTSARYVTKGSPPRNVTHPINFSVDPWEGGFTKEKFEARYGPGSGDRHKWFGFDNEHKSNFVRPTLQELFASHPEALQVSNPAEFDGQPTDLEVEDCAAAGHTALTVQARELLQWQGTENNPIVVRDPAKPERYTERNILGLWEDHFLNLTPKPKDPPPPPPPPPPSPPPPSRYRHAFLEKAAWADFLHYFDKRIAWPIASTLSRHPEIQKEALETWLRRIDASPSGRVFQELRAKYER